MTFAATSSAVVIGLSGHIVRIEADLSMGPSGFHLMGMPLTTTAETRDRVRAAIINSGWEWPDQQVTVNVLPVGMPKYGAALDLAIAVAILAADGKIPLHRLTDTAFLGELGLDGSIRPVRSLPCAIRVLIMSGIRCVAIPFGNAGDSPRCALIPATSLTELVQRLNSDRPAPPGSGEDPPSLDLADVSGNHAARQALEICAAGGHHLLLLGEGPAAMMAERLPGILPPLDDITAAQVADIYSLTESLRNSRRPPLCAPHYTNTAAAIFGRRKANVLRPGAVSLAHGGVLFLDQAPEYARSILDGLHLPLDSGEVILADQAGILHLPARFQLLLASSSCPCSGSCVCGQTGRRRYLNRLATLRERIEITAPIHPLDRHAKPGEASSTVAERVAAARARAAHRLAASCWRTNAQIPAMELRTTYRLNPDALDPLESRLRSGALTPRTLTRLLRLAWTLADLRAANRPTRDDTQQALQLWYGESA
ncbi:ATP-binding protein [Nonomuraea sp. NPDC002799]